MIELTRVFDWRTKMQENLHAIERVPFEWGVHDCALFAADHVRAITETDFGVDFRGNYTTAFGAAKILKEKGCDDLLDLCKKLFPEVHPAFADAGDLLILEAPDTGYALAIVIGETIGVLTPNGYGILHRTDKRIKTGFKVG
jgi:hypothetical protein